MNWGKSIVLVFVLFAAFIGILVTVCLRQDISLVSKDYYKDELEYGRQMQKEINTEQLINRPVIELTRDQMLKVYFSDFGKMENGELILYSPGDITQDRKFPLVKNNDAMQLIPTTSFRKGKYKASMTWTVAGKEFYYQTQIIL